MAHERTKEDILKLSLEAIDKHELLFIEDVVAYLPICKATFYQICPLGSYELNTIKEKLEAIKISWKVGMRKDWKGSTAPVLQVALMKIIGTDEEAARLNGSRQELKVEAVQPLFPDVD